MFGIESKLKAEVAELKKQLDSKEEELKKEKETVAKKTANVR